MKGKTHSKRVKNYGKKIKDFIRSINNNNSDNYDEKYMKIRFNSDDEKH